MKINQN